MSIPTSVDTWRVTYHQKVSTVKMETVIHVTAPWTADPHAVASDAAAAWMATGSINVIQCSSVAYGDITVQPYDGVTAPLTLTVTGYSGSSGNATGSPVPCQVSAILTLRSLLAGRSRRGRVYIAGLQSIWVESGGARWDSTHLSNIQAAGNAWRTALNGSTTIDELSIYSVHLNSKTSCSSILARQYFGTQRRRAEQAEKL